MVLIGMLKMNKILSVLLFTFISLTGFSQHAAEVNASLGAGVNGYNMFVSNALAWPSYYFTDLKAKGFNSVRIVYIGPTVEITTANLLMIKDAVDECLAADLIPVIDFHIPPNYWATYTTEKGNLFVSNWTTTAAYFADYAYDELVLELVNEPSDGQLVNEPSDGQAVPPTFTASMWNTLAASAVTAIRAQDADRIIMVSPFTYGHLEGLSTFTLPADTSLILSIHYYKPEWVINQNVPWEGPFYGMRYTGTHFKNIQPIIDNFEEEFQSLFDFQTDNDNVPVNIGEWGTWLFVDSLNRIDYATMLCRWFESKGWSHMVWEYDDYFGIVKNPTLGYEETREYYPGLAEAITTTPLTLNSYDSTIIFEEDAFSSTTGWTTYQNGGGAVNITTSSPTGSLKINVTATDYIALNARVYTPLFDLEKDSIYRVTYITRTESGEKYLAHKYAGPNYPIGEYQGPYHPPYETFGLTTSPVTRYATYVDPFATQLDTKLEFLVGVGTGTMYIDYIKIEKLTMGDEIVAGADTIAPGDTIFFKNYDLIVGADTITSTECGDTSVYRDIVDLISGTVDTIGLINFCSGSDQDETDWLEVYYYPYTDSVTMTDGSRFIPASGLNIGSSGVWPGYYNMVNVDPYYHYLTNTNNDPDTAYIHGADPNAYFRVGLYASRTGTGSNLTYMTIGSETVSINPYNNSTLIVSIDSIVPTIDSLITIIFDRTDGGYGYFGALEVEKTILSLEEDTTQSYIVVNNVDFGTGFDQLDYSVNFVQDSGSKSFELRLDSIDGPVIDSFFIVGSDTDGCAIRTASIDTVSGVHNLYALIEPLDEYTWLYFKQSPVVPTQIIYISPFRNIVGSFYIGNRKRNFVISNR
jgi:hypothetical protein